MMRSKPCWALGQTALTVVAKRALGKSWACGHPVTPDNIAPVGAGRSKCRICRNAYTLRWMNEHNAAKRAGLPYSRRQLDPLLVAKTRGR